MPVPFQPTTIPLVSGVRQDIAKYAATDDPRLVTAENCVFTRRGSVIGRPGAQSREAATQTDGAGTALGGNLNTIVSGLTPSGIAGSLGGGSLGRETALALFQGAGYALKDTVWQAVGFPWSTRVTRSNTLTMVKASSRQAPTPCGTSVVGRQVSVGAHSGFPFVNSNGEVSYVGTASAATLDAAGQSNIAAAGDALFYTSTAGTVYGVIPGTLPATSVVTVGSGSSTSTSQRQNVWAVQGESGSYYVAYVSATAGHIVLKRLDSSGTVTATLDQSGLGTVLGCSICFNGVNKLALAWIDTAGPTMKTKVFTTTSGSITDAAIDLSYGTAPETNSALFGFALGLTAAGDASLLYTTSTASLYIGGRLFTAATLTNTMTLQGIYTGFGTGEGWDPLFAGVVVGGRTLIGVMHGTDTLLHTFQWIVLDVTRLYTSNVANKVVVAAGAVGGSDKISVSPVGQPDANSVSFSVPEGLTFDTLGVATAGVVRVTVSLQPCQATYAHSLSLLSGGALCSFDGSQAKPLGFVEGAPFVLGSSQMVVGALVAGSYSYQATWEATNARGQVVRSGASNKLTLTSAGAQSARIDITVPQLRDYFTSGDTVRVKLYASEKDPSAGAALYYFTETTITTWPATNSISLTHNAQVDTSQEQLYTSGNVLADEQPPAGDRGVAYAVQRVWVANQRNVYASKLLDTRRAPAWNTEGLHTIPMPASLGQVQTLAGLDDKLVVLCTGGVAVVYGAGFDDLGNGPGWQTTVVQHIGCMPGSPRVAAVMPEGVAFLGTDGDVWLVTTGGQVQPLSRPVRDARVTSAYDVAYIPSRADFNCLLVSLGSSTARVLDCEASAWSTWTGFSGVSYVAAVNGVLWALTASGQVRVQSYDGTQGSDLGASFDQVVKTGILRPSGSTSGWGRFRGLTVMEVPGTYTQTVKVYADNLETVILNKSAQIVPTASAVWPYSQNPQYRATQQRCSFLSVELRATPGVAEWNAVNLWTAASQEQAPGRTRS